MFHDPARSTPTLAELLAYFDDVTPERTGWVALCPGHADSRPSLRIGYNAEEKKVVLRCRSAGCATKDVLTAVGLTMAHLFNVEPGDLTDVRSTGREARALGPGELAPLTQHLARAEAALHDDQGADALAYISRRFGVSEELAGELGLGYDRGTLDSGKISLSRRKYRNAPRVLVPFNDFDGNPHGFQGRALTNAEPKWSGPSNPEGATWGRYGVLSAGSDRPEILLTEGPGDGLTAVAAGYDAVVIRGACLGESPGLAEELAAGLKGRPVIVAGDNDTAGVKFARDVTAGLASRGIDVRKLALPDGVNDLAAWYGRDGEDFAEALASAVAQAEALPTGGAGAGTGAGRATPDYDRRSTSDSHVSTRIVHQHLRGRWSWSAALGWLQWDGRRWKPVKEQIAREDVRKALLAMHREDTTAAAKELQVAQAAVNAEMADAAEGDQSRLQGQLNEIAKAHAERIRQLGAYLTFTKIRNVMALVQGQIAEDTAEFDARAELLNVGNGVVDLRTGELLPHRPEFRFTKITEVNYTSDATHADWDKALLALPEESREWLRIRFGQAATGFTPDDDVVPFLYGGGSNGKSTVVLGVTTALGEFAEYIPDKVLLLNPGDHPTEMMTLLGARLALLEELPQGRFLDAKRLKTVAGTGKITARYTGKDNVSWTPTHSLFVTTNYELRVDENDHGTWRRLARVPFPYKFGEGLPKDGTLRPRIEHGEDGQHEAVLAWIVAGAIDWYKAGRMLPPAPDAVAAATREWRGTADILGRFLDEATELDEGAAVLSRELYDVFRNWAAEHGHKAWTDQLFWERLKSHDAVTSGAVTRPAGTARLSGRKFHTVVGVQKPAGPARFVFGLRFAEEAKNYRLS